MRTLEAPVRLSLRLRITLWKRVLIHDYFVAPSATTLSRPPKASLGHYQPLWSVHCDYFVAQTYKDTASCYR